ncbi:MAG: hypothetical protein ACRCZO_17475 [Cetobacterium sp.]
MYKINNRYRTGRDSPAKEFLGRVLVRPEVDRIQDPKRNLCPLVVGQQVWIKNRTGEPDDKGPVKKKYLQQDKVIEILDCNTVRLAQNGITSVEHLKPERLVKESTSESYDISA